MTDQAFLTYPNYADEDDEPELEALKELIINQCKKYGNNPFNNIAYNIVMEGIAEYELWANYMPSDDDEDYDATIDHHINSLGKNYRTKK